MFTGKIAYEWRRGLGEVISRRGGGEFFLTVPKKIRISGIISILGLE